MSTQSELKENLLANHLEGTVRWVVENRSKALTVLAILTGAILIGSVVYFGRQQAVESATTRLAMAEAFIAQRQFDQAKQILADLKTKTSDRNVSQFILYYQAQAAIGQRNPDEAIQSLTDLVGRSSREPIRPLALEALGFAYEEKNDYESAARTYQQFMTAYPEHFLAARTQLLLGKALAAGGKRDEAKQALEQLIDLYPTSPWAEKARTFIDKNKTR